MCRLLRLTPETLLGKPKPFFVTLKNGNSSSFGKEILAKMPRTENTKRQLIHLDEYSYNMLRQKASYSRQSMSSYLKSLALEADIISYNILVHDLTKMIDSIDNITFKASGYYYLVAERDDRYPEVGLDDGENMIKLFQKLSDFLENYYKDFTGKRKELLTEEEMNIAKAINSAKRSSYRDLTIKVNNPSSFTAEILMIAEEKEQMLKNISESGMPQSDLSSYFRNLIISKRYIFLTRETEDLFRMGMKIYAGTDYCQRFLTMMYHQGFECADQAKELEVLYNKVLHYENEIWNMVENDRLMIFEKYDAKIHEPVPTAMEHKFKKSRRRKEKGAWQSQE